jgi:hypothetical protein
MNRGNPTKNILVCLIIMAGVYLVSLATTPVAPDKPTAYRETILPTSLYPDNSTWALNQDLRLIKTSINQTAMEQQIAAKGFRYSQQTFGQTELDQRIGLLSLTIRQLDASQGLSINDKNSLIAQGYGLINPLLKDLSDPWLSNVYTSGLTGSYPPFLTYIHRVELVKIADDQLISEQLFNQLTAKFVNAINRVGAAGNSTADLSADLTTMTSDVSSAMTFSKIEATIATAAKPQLKVINAKLTTASLDISVAYQTAVQIINLLSTN